MFPRAECTKETRSSNQQRYQQHQQPMNPEEFLRPVSSSMHQHMPFRHDHYSVDPFSSQILHQSPVFQQNGERMLHPLQSHQSHLPQSTRDIGKNRFNTPVQSTMQNQYFMANYETLNQLQGGGNPFIMEDIQANRNPVNTKRDQMVKTRLQDKKEFLNQQGGMMNRFVDLTPQYTRKDKPEINTSSYVPMARTLAIPKEHL